MKTVILKFGGTSVGTIDRIKKVSNIIGYYKKQKFNVIVVSSAILENFSISFLFIEFIIDHLWT